MDFFGVIILDLYTGNSAMNHRWYKKYNVMRYNEYVNFDRSLVAQSLSDRYLYMCVRT